MPISKGFLIASGFKSNGFPVAATGTLDFATVQPTADDSIVINGRTYTFKSTLTTPAVADEILIGASAIATNANTIAAINGAAGEGTLYSTGTVQNVDGFAVEGASSDELDFEAFDRGTGGNAITTTEAGTSPPTWATGTLTGGLDGGQWRVPVLLGADDGLELISESITMDSQLINSEGAIGARSRGSGDRGNEFHAGDAVFDMKYRGLEVLLAVALGQSAAPLQSGVRATALLDYASVLPTASDTVVINTRTYTFVAAIATADDILIGADADECNANLIAAINGASGAGTKYHAGTARNVDVIAEEGPSADEMLITAILAGTVPNAYATTSAGTTPPTWGGAVMSGGTFEEAYESVFQVGDSLEGLMGTLVLDKLVSVWEYPSAKVNSMAIANAAGAIAQATIGFVGSSLNRNQYGGINNKATTPLITVPTERQFILFEHLNIWMNAAGADDFTDSDLVYPNEFNVNMDSQMAADDVTTRYHREIDEAQEDGFFEVSGTIGFSKYEEERFVDASQTKALQKIKAEWVGAIVTGALSVRTRMTLYLPEAQISTASPNMSGPGRVPLPAEFVAARNAAGVDPVGFPATYGSFALNIEMVNGRSTNPIASV